MSESKDSRLTTWLRDGRYRSPRVDDDEGCETDKEINNIIRPVYTPQRLSRARRAHSVGSLNLDLSKVHELRERLNVGFVPPKPTPESTPLASPNSTSTSSASPNSTSTSELTSPNNSTSTSELTSPNYSPRTKRNNEFAHDRQILTNIGNKLSALHL